jgi:hypothetical protein
MELPIPEPSNSSFNGFSPCLSFQIDCTAVRRSRFVFSSVLHSGALELAKPSGSAQGDASTNARKMNRRLIRFVSS